jgi:hypothetical protein
MNSTQEILFELRESEKMYRRRGAFDIAVQCQRSVDYIETHGKMDGDFCCWFDRGIDRAPYWDEHEHLLGIALPNGNWLWMPKDVQFQLWILLTQMLKFTSADLIEAAGELYRNERDASALAESTHQEESP